MNLSVEKIESTRQGEPVRFIVDDVEFVVLRADLFDRVKDRLDDDGVWTEEEMEGLAAQMFDRLDDSEPIG